MTIDNPFVVNNYASPQLFCDREAETERIGRALRNGRHVILYSPRRYGKTGLIHHVFDGLAKKRGNRTIFADIYSANDVHEFNTILLNAVHEALNPTPAQFLKNATKWFSSLRPVVQFDDLSGQPSISLERSNHKQETATTREIFRILNEQSGRVYLAIDEFQQVATFPNVRMDAVLRTELQRSPNIHCIFSGSQRHILLDLFNNASKPFYGSADQLELHRIDRDVYADFACKLMKRHKRALLKDDAIFCYDWCRGHTYYVQVLFNRMFGDGRPLNRTTIVDVMLSIVREQDAIMVTLRSALTKNQWDLFEAVSKEGEVSTPTGGVFIKKYGLGSSAALVLALQALMDRELIYITDHNKDNGKPVYAVYNPFHAAWFKYR